MSSTNSLGYFALIRSAGSDFVPKMKTLAHLFIVAISLTCPALRAQVTAMPLSRFYSVVIPAHFPISNEYTASAIRSESPPNIMRRQGEARFLPYYPGDEMLFVVNGIRFGSPEHDVSLWSSVGSHLACPEYQKRFVLPNQVTAGLTVNYSSTWFTPYGAAPCSDLSLGPAAANSWDIRDTITFSPPERRKAMDGSEFDASRMHITRNGTPWMAYYWGYRLGLVENSVEWSVDGLRVAPELGNWPDLPSATQEYSLASLPPPWIEEDVVEYVNTIAFPRQPDGQYFYAVRSEDKMLLDSINTWRRTGNTFKSGGYVSVCRFYGGSNGGPNTHFYSASDGECAALKERSFLTYEGQTFAVNMPMPPKNAAQSAPGALRDCPVGTKPLFRLYNNASASAGGFVSNHRYTTEQSDVAKFIAKGWLNEGHVMCVPT